ncbi:hypothetical protein BJ912DRAFT_973467, partial [Pholiota molesta]
MPALAFEPCLKVIDLSRANGPSSAKVILIPLPKNTVGILFGQMLAAWPQRFNTYLLDTNNIVVNPQVVWDASSDGSRFDVSQVVPMNLLPQDKNVFSVGPFSEDRNLAVYCSHKKAGATSYTESDPRHSFQAFKIGNKNAISFTMVSALCWDS